MTENPGYLKLRKIRAAQHIAQTVRQMLLYNIAMFLFLFQKDLKCPEQSLPKCRSLDA